MEKFIIDIEKAKTGGLSDKYNFTPDKRDAILRDISESIGIRIRVKSLEQSNALVDAMNNGIFYTRFSN